MKEKRQVSLLTLWNRTNLSHRVVDSKECTTTNMYCTTESSSYPITTSNSTTKKEDHITTEITSVVDTATPSTIEEQQENEPHRTISTSTCGGTNDGDPKDYQPSDYELLRLQKIARNEAKLRELGLLTSITSTIASQSSNLVRNQPKKRRRRQHLVLPLPSGDTLPHTTVRRSARLSQHTPTHTNQTTLCTTHSKLAPSSSLEDENRPLFHQTDADARNFSISSSFRTSRSTGTTNPNTSGPILWKGGTLPTNQPVKTKLIPPNGLGAIYTLQFSSSDNTNRDHSLCTSTSSYVVGAGKSGMIALWDISPTSNSSGSTTTTTTTTTNLQDDSRMDQHPLPYELHPMVAWKAHSGRWISSAVFLPSLASSITNTNGTATTAKCLQQHLITAGNDGSICLWDVSIGTGSTAIPRLHYQSDQSLHSSGIFAMDVVGVGQPSELVSSSSPLVSICTGSKDKSIAVSEMTPTQFLSTTWRSYYHTSKVGAVRIQPNPKVVVIASASDDGLVALHDVRTTAVISTIPHAHRRPHSVEWIPSEESSPLQFVTAGWDDTIHLFDLRNVCKPTISFRGHHSSSSSTDRRNRIHRPCLGRWATTTNGSYNTFLLTGGDDTHSLFVYPCPTLCTTEPWERNPSPVQPTLRQGLLPHGYGDVGSLTVQNNRLCLSTTTNGDILLLDQPPFLWE